MKTVSIKETSKGVWRVTFDGRVLGDSRGYRKQQAIDEARNIVDCECKYATRDNREMTLVLDPTYS